MPFFTALGTAMLPLVGGFFMIILRDPDLARRAGLISAKAQITVGNADWLSFFGFLSLANAVGGFILFGIIAIWVFGREYSDRTLKDLLALPTSRSAIVLAKLLVIACWSVALIAMMLLIGLGVGAAVRLPPVSASVMLNGMLLMVVPALLTLLLVTPIAFFACLGHGYLAPFGVMILAVALAQIIAVLGWGEYFPWAIPGLYSQGEALGAVSYLIVILTSLAGGAGTLAWWQLADQTR
jgi:ABC-2 type transport system permease protein